MNVTQKTPTFETIQWTGSNLQDVSNFVNQRNVTTVNFSVLSDGPDQGALVGSDGSYFSLFVLPSSHILYGPRWDSDVSWANFQTRSPSELSAQFQEVV